MHSNVSGASLLLELLERLRDEEAASRLLSPRLSNTYARLPVTSPASRESTESATASIDSGATDADDEDGAAKDLAREALVRSNFVEEDARKWLVNLRALWSRRAELKLESRAMLEVRSRADLGPISGRSRPREEHSHLSMISA